MNDSSETAKPFSIAARLKSFRYAFRGVRLMLATQHNAWVHAAISLAVIGAAIVLRVSRSDWCWLILAMVAVWVAETINTAFEMLCDVASPGFHPMVEKAKDVAAGAVLISAVGAIAIGLLVFIPELIARVR